MKENMYCINTVYIFFYYSNCFFFNSRTRTINESNHIFLDLHYGNWM